jgi:hypothetical protein
MSLYCVKIGGGMIKKYNGEIWKVINGYEDYSISNYGRVISFKNKYGIGQILKADCNKGYLYVNLYNNGYRKKMRIHRLVALSFIKNQNPNILIEVNHIDKNKLNNHTSNLEWCTKQRNNEHGKSKIYEIQFPDYHTEMVYNLDKFCRKNNLDARHMRNSFKSGYFHKGYKVLNIIEQDGSMRESVKSYRIMYKIFDSSRNIIENIYNLTKFCKENNLNIDSMRRTVNDNYFHRGFKLIERFERNGNITKIKNLDSN